MYEMKINFKVTYLITLEFLAICTNTLKMNVLWTFYTRWSESRCIRLIQVKLELNHTKIDFGEEHGGIELFFIVVDE